MSVGRFCEAHWEADPETREVHLVLRMSAANPGYGTGILGSYFINDLGTGMIFELFRTPFDHRRHSPRWYDQAIPSARLPLGLPAQRKTLSLHSSLQQFWTYAEALP